jgi:acetoin utilization protein AcuB
MIAEQLISPSVPVLLATDSGDKALGIMDDNRLDQLPLVDHEESYLGLVLEKDLMDWSSPGQPLESAEFINYKPAIAAISHPYEALRLSHQMQLHVIPVVDNENKYLGSITSTTLLKYVAENNGIEMPGGILVIEVAPRDYTLYEIARICENEDVQIISTQMNTRVNGMLEITIKTNRTDLEGVVSSLERHKYKVLEVYGMINHLETMMERYHLLMNYINI